MKTSKRKANGLHHSAPAIQTPKLPTAEEQIRHRAHEIYIARGEAAGMALNDWLQAERDLKQRLEG